MNKSVYKLFMNELRRELNDHDPIGLIELDTPQDEYDLERGLIAPKLRTCHGIDDVQQMIHEIFAECFGQNVAGSKERYCRLARSVWKLWNKFDPACEVAEDADA